MGVATSNAARVGSGTIPNSYIGTKARIFQGTSLCSAASNFTYNDGTKATMSSSLWGFGCSGDLTSRGQVRVYTGSGVDHYVLKTTNTSPVVHI